MKINPLVGTLLERHQTEHAKALAEDLKAIMDYNVMMGVLEDPMAEDEEDEDDE